MKKTQLLLMTMCGFVLFSWGTAMAYHLDDGTDVGGLDKLVASISLGNSGDDTELDWVQGVLGSGYTLEEKYDMGETVGNMLMDWKITNQEGTYALNLLGSPAYFFIKTGAKPNEVDHFLFENLDSLSWAVIHLPDLEIKNIGKLSHVGEVVGGGAPPSEQIPEPGTILLLGGGLLSLAFFGRGRKVY